MQLPGNIKLVVCDAAACNTHLGHLGATLLLTTKSFLRFKILLKQELIIKIVFAESVYVLMVFHDCSNRGAMPGNCWAYV